MTRIHQYPWSARGAALTGVLLLLVLETVSLATAPAGLRSFLGGVLLGSSTAALLLALLLERTRRRALSRLAVPGPDAAAGRTGGVPADFPMDRVRPVLLAPDAPRLNLLYTGWVFAVDGRDARWISHRLGLPPDTARLLTDAARHRGTTGPA
ncbi:hypothetical protein [Kitasatospora cineracea]|uniref:hypothetical protein n=1 Tax=Kitasatospora cineracea TaxID=88074 RepID=UPI0037F9D289